MCVISIKLVIARSNLFLVVLAIATLLLPCANAAHPPSGFECVSRNDRPPTAQCTPRGGAMRVGKGSYGSVYKGVATIRMPNFHVNKKTQVALKKLEEIDSSHLEREFEVLEALHKCPTGVISGSSGPRLPLGAASFISKKTGLELPKEEHRKSIPARMGHAAINTLAVARSDRRDTSRARPFRHWLVLPWVEGNTLERWDQQIWEEVRRGDSNDAYVDFAVRLVPIVEDLVCGLLCLRDNRISHGDIKPRNIMVGRRAGENRESDRERAFLVDFGESSFIHAAIKFGDKKSVRAAMEMEYLRETTLMYRTLEWARGEWYAYHQDTYALGTSLTEILTPQLGLHLSRLFVQEVLNQKTAEEIEGNLRWRALTLWDFALAIGDAFNQTRLDVAELQELAEKSNAMKAKITKRLDSRANPAYYHWVSNCARSARMPDSPPPMPDSPPPMPDSPPPTPDSPR